MVALIDVQRFFFLLSFLFVYLSPLSAFEYTKGHIVVSHPWARVMLPKVKVGLGSLIINNYGTESDRLMSLVSDVARRTAIYEMLMENDVMKMRQVDNGVTIRSGECVVFKPSGYHIMFFDPQKPFRKGDSFKASLLFEKAGQIDVIFRVDSG
ncbi:MAG: hypothetical protein JSC161_000081 [Candidatus Tokpelaia sp. JSC161]|jgi:hypothetical protein|nr:MAG: hypothetical protein JSC161_000081 [Candidatus Tokpelaia sp. JSC161]